ncbi:MAG: hypothetical protein JXA37_05870 [Chloroflexia bacterium]|nr:hypothetical protein [Chloroflexia bacterium]
MNRWMRNRFGFLLWVLALLSLFVAACRTDGTGSSVGPQTAAVPPSQAPVTAAGPAGPPSPTKPAHSATAPTAPPLGQTSASGEVALTLTILHTGEVYGEILPCG